MAAQPVSDMPSASAMAFIEEAVPMVLQWPTLGAEAQVMSMNCVDVDLAVGQHPARVPDHRARAGELAAVVAVQHRPAGQHDRRDVDAWPRP